MFRKFSLAVFSCMLLLLAFGATSALGADAHQYCNDNNLPKGVYPPDQTNPQAGDIGTFDMTYEPSTANTDTSIGGGALVCGTPTNGSVLVQDVVLEAPGYDEQSRCASPFCSGALPDGTFTGTGQSDVWCGGGILCLFKKVLNDQPTDAYIAYDTSGPVGDDNDCVVTADGYTPISCSEAVIGGGIVSCRADTIIREKTFPAKRGGGGLQPRPKRRSVQLYIETGHCSIGPANLNVIGIDALTLCQYAGVINGTECGTNHNDWVNKTGSKGPWQFKATINWSDGSKSYGAVTGNWL